MLRFKLIILLITVSFISCIKDRNITSIPFSPDIVDGVYFITLNDHSNEDLFSGDWGAPILEKGETFSRHLLNGTGKLRFFIPRVEKYILKSKFLNSVDDLKVTINGKKISFNGKRKFINKNFIKEGENIISFSTKKDLKIHEVDFFPARLLRINNYENKFKQGNVLLFPGSMKYYLKPIGDEYIFLKLDRKNETNLKFEINFKSVNGIIEKKIVRISDKNSLKIYPKENIFQEIELKVLSPKNGILKIKDSLLSSSTSIPDKTDKNIAEIKKNVKGKNLLIVLLDATRRDHVGYIGYKKDTTPNIDRISKESQLFNNCYSEASFTLASTGTLLTGISPDFHGVVSKFYSALDPEIFTIGNMFEEIGYFTGAISGNPNFGKAYRYNKGFLKFLELFEDHPIVIAEEFLKPFENMLNRTNGKQFFVYLHIREPHDPFYMPPPFLGKFQNKFDVNDQSLKNFGKIFHNSYVKKQDNVALLNNIYDENLAYGDMVFGKIVELLKRKKIFSDTVIVFLADHGEAIGEHRMIGHGHVLYQEGINIPMLLRIPGMKKRVYNDISITSDLILTLSELFDLNFRYKKITYGENLFLLPKERRIISRSINIFNYPSYSIIQYPYKLIVNFPIIEKNIKIFDLKNDPHENILLKSNFLIRKSLLFYLFNHLKNSKKFKNRVVKPNLKKSDLKSLKSLGYIQ